MTKLANVVKDAKNVQLGLESLKGKGSKRKTYIVDALNSWRKPETERVNFTEVSPALEQLTTEQIKILKRIATSKSNNGKFRFEFGTESLPWRWQYHFPAIVVILFMIAAFTVGGLIKGNKIGDEDVKKRMKMSYMCASSELTVDDMKKNCCRYDYGRVRVVPLHYTAGEHCSNVWFASGSFLLLAIAFYYGGRTYTYSEDLSFLIAIGTILFICAVGMTIPLTTKRRSAEAAEYIENQEEESPCKISIMKRRGGPKPACLKNICAHLYKYKHGRWVLKENN